MVCHTAYKKREEKVNMVKLVSCIKAMSENQSAATVRQLQRLLSAKTCF